MKPLVLAAAILALSAPAALAQAAPRSALEHKAADATQAQSDVPDAVKTYVRAHAGSPLPYSGGEIRVGHRVDDSSGVWLSIPDYPQYEYSNLGGQLVVADKKTGNVVALY